MPQPERWRGVPLAIVLEQAEPSPEALWVEASAGAFRVSIPLDAARSSFLALRLGDEPLPVTHGGPVRLVVPGGDCYTSVKWLDRVELRDEPGPNTGRTIALERLSPRAGGPLAQRPVRGDDLPGKLCVSAASRRGF